MTTVKDPEILRQVSVEVHSASEAIEILAKLEDELAQYDHGIGLAAIQIGIPKRVGLIIHNGQRYELINPRLIDHDDEFLHHKEGCLSIPNTYITVPRYSQITIDNMVFDETEENGWRREKHVHYVGDDKNDLTTIAIQHEMDHFDGFLITDKEFKPQPIKVEVKTKRNDPCPCGSGKKYKKCCLNK